MHQQLNFSTTFKHKKLDGFIVTNPVNIFYLTGFKGISPTEREAILIFSNQGPTLITPTLITARLYQNEAIKLKSKNLKVEIVDERNQILALIQKLLKKANRVGFEENDLKYSEHKDFKKAFSTRTVLVPIKNAIEDLRILKTEEEIKKIEKAQIISQKAFEILVKTLKAGQTEVEIAEKLAKIIKSLGGQGLAFESIIASGKNSALPHYLTGKKKIKKGEVLLLDFGAKYQDYCADLSRTIFIGKANTRKQNIYNLVKKAQREAVDSIVGGHKSSDAYQKANEVFKKEKLNKYFIHSLGHGIGLEVHEAPHLRPTPTTSQLTRSTTDDRLMEGMVFSVEPGLYFPNWGGVRIEDLVTITNGKAKVLGKLQKEIIVI